MIQRYFVDTWYFIARIEPRDVHNRAAYRLGNLVPSAAMVSHDGVLTEVLTYFCEDGPRGRELAVEAVRRALRAVEIVPTDRRHFLAALDLYERRPDKGYSLVDCMSMELMKARGITHVLTNDHHFRQEGFTVLSDAQ
jgi:uncharacterized protein